MRELVSIIVPIYNVEDYLRRCIDSLLEQTYPNTEVILVDDGSPDNCPAIADSYAEQHAHVQVIHKANGGLSDARKFGWLAAKGEYILFVDSDDYILPSMVEELVRGMQTQQADLAICSYCTENGNNQICHHLDYTEKIIGKPELPEKYIYPLMGKGKDLNIPGFLCIRLMKRKLMEAHYFVSENLYFMEDHVFDLEYADKINRIAVVNKPLYVYCINRASLSNRYRPNKWKMYVNLHQYFCDYAARRGFLPPEERLNAFLIGGMFASIDNAVLSGSFSTFKREIKNVKSTLLIKSAQYQDSLTCTSVPLSYKVSFTLLKYGMLHLLYVMRRFILNRNNG